MSRISFFAIAALATLPVYGRVDRGDFTRWYEQRLRGPLQVSREQIQKARSFHYVLVKGFLGEVGGGYYADNRNELQAWGVPNSHIDIVSPSSHRSFVDNLPLLTNKFGKHFVGDEKLVIIAHSRGAVDTLAWALYNAGPIQKYVKDIFLLQGAFGGSGVADYFAGCGHEVDSRMEKYTTLFPILRNIYYGYYLNLWLGTGLGSLRRDNSSRFWRQMLSRFQDQIPLIRDKIHFVTASISDPDRASFILRPTAWYLKTYYGPNDGLVAIDDQAIEEVGNIVLATEGDHADFSSPQPISGRPPIYRHAFTSAAVLGAVQP